jgi:hypothetical protein
MLVAFRLIGLAKPSFEYQIPSQTNTPAACEYNEKNSP